MGQCVLYFYSFFFFGPLVLLKATQKSELTVSRPEEYELYRFPPFNHDVG